MAEETAAEKAAREAEEAKEAERKLAEENAKKKPPEKAPEGLEAKVDRIFSMLEKVLAPVTSTTGGKPNEVPVPPEKRKEETPKPKKSLLSWLM